MHENPKVPAAITSPEPPPQVHPVAAPTQPAAAPAPEPIAFSGAAKPVSFSAPPPPPVSGEPVRVSMSRTALPPEPGPAPRVRVNPLTGLATGDLPEARAAQAAPTPVRTATPGWYPLSSGFAIALMTLNVGGVFGGEVNFVWMIVAGVIAIVSGSVYQKALVIYQIGKHPAFRMAMTPVWVAIWVAVLLVGVGGSALLGLVAGQVWAPWVCAVLVFFSVSALTRWTDLRFRACLDAYEAVHGPYVQQ